MTLCVTDPYVLPHFPSSDSYGKENTHMEKKIFFSNKINYTSNYPKKIYQNFDTFCDNILSLFSRIFLKKIYSIFTFLNEIFTNYEKKSDSIKKILFDSDTYHNQISTSLLNDI